MVVDPQDRDPKYTVAYLVRIYYQFPRIFNILKKLLQSCSLDSDTIISLLTENGDTAGTGPLLSVIETQTSVCTSLLPSLDTLTDPNALFLDQLPILQSWQDNYALDPFFDSLLNMFTFMLNTVHRSDNYSESSSLINFSPESISRYTNVVQLIVSHFTCLDLDNPQFNTTMTPLVRFSEQWQQFCNHFKFLQHCFPSYLTILQESLHPTTNNLIRSFWIVDSVENSQMINILEGCLAATVDMKNDWNAILLELVSFYI